MWLLLITMLTRKFHLFPKYAPNVANNFNRHSLLSPTLSASFTTTTTTSNKVMLDDFIILSKSQVIFVAIIITIRFGVYLFLFFLLFLNILFF